MIKYLNTILAIVIAVLLLFSILALIEIHWRLENIKFSFTPEGIEYYLASLGKYKLLFSGTIATCSAYFGLLSVKATNESNADKKKQDRFNEWKTILQIGSSEVLRRDTKIIKHFTQNRQQIFNSLYELQFKIEHVEQLTAFFNLHFKDHVNTFEIHNYNRIKLGAAYPNFEFSYSFESFSTVFFVMIESWYDEIHSDLERLYIDNLPENRIINAQAYKSAIDAVESISVSYADI